MKTKKDIASQAISKTSKWKSALTAGILASLPVVSVVAASTYTQSIERKELSQDELDMSVPQIQAIIQKKMPALGELRSRAVAIRVSELCARYDLKASFVLAVIQAESRFRPTVVSSAGAIGLMQLLPSTASYIAELNDVASYEGAKDLENPVMNVTLGIHYLGYLKKKHPDPSALLSAYNMGPAKYRRVAAQDLSQYRGVLKYVSEIHEGQYAMIEQGKSLTSRAPAASDIRI